MSNPYDCFVCHNEGYDHAPDCSFHPDNLVVREARSGIWFEIKWWSRWLVLYAPRQYWLRFTGCEHRNHYDHEVCLDCGKRLGKR